MVVVYFLAKYNNLFRFNKRAFKVHHYYTSIHAHCDSDMKNVCHMSWTF